MKKMFTAVFVLLSLCASAQKNKQAAIDSMLNIVMGEGELPPGFTGNATTILVIFKDKVNSVNKYLEKALEKEYTGQYRLLEQGETLSPKDTANVRYAVQILTTFKPGYFAAGGRQAPETEYRMMMLDRVSKTTYLSNKSTSCFSCLFKSYFKMLDKERMK